MSTTIDISTTPLGEALAAVAAVLGDTMLSIQQGPGFTCSEADTIANLLVVAGHPEAAVMWLSGHALGDEDTGDDEHHGLDGEDAARVYVAEHFPYA